MMMLQKPVHPQSIPVIEMTEIQRDINLTSEIEIELVKTKLVLSLSSEIQVPEYVNHGNRVEYAHDILVNSLTTGVDISV